ncbi:MAG: glucose 1-dehydrogenase [Actinomyces sp.]|nr:MAG: glucose 1-dehydrogenase [Actinomyces sp.]
MTDGHTGSTLAGRTILVTGGGTGIGRACARRLAAEGALVTVCGRTAERLEETARLVAAETGARVGVVVADVTDEDQVAAAVRRAAGDEGHLWGLVANAGGGGALAPYDRQDVAEFRRVLELNVVGTMVCVKHALPRMVAGGGGSIVAVSSLAAHVTHRFFGAYPPAKAGVEAVVRNVADEFGPAGVRANAVRPGFIATEIMEAIPRDSPVFASYVANTPLGGVGEPDDVAALVRFLLSDEARWITGTAIEVDGGHALRRGPDFSAFVPGADEIGGGGPP